MFKVIFLFKSIIQNDLKNKGENKKTIRWQIKFFNLRVKLNWKIVLTKKKKRMRVRLNKQNFDWKMKLKTKKTLAKRPMKKITNQKTNDQNEKKHMKNCNWMNKLKNKIRNKKSEDWNWKTKNKEDNRALYLAWKRKEGKKTITNDNPTTVHHHTPHLWKRTQWHIQRDSERLVLATEWRQTHNLNSTDATHSLVHAQHSPIIFLF